MTRLGIWVSLFVVLLAGCAAHPPVFHSGWPAAVRRPWAGPDYWTNPLEDWRVADSRLECIAAGGNRNVYLLTRELDAQPGTLKMTVELGRLDPDTGPLKEGFAGFRFGIRGAFHDYRDSAVRGHGVDAGISSDGRLFIGRLAADSPKLATDLRDVVLRLEARPSSSTYTVSLDAKVANGIQATRVVRDGIPAGWMKGGLALVCHSGRIRPTPPRKADLTATGRLRRPDTRRGGTLRFWFKDWTVSGTKVQAHPERAFGPILFTLHTLSRRVLKLTAQMAPVGNAPRRVGLEIRNRDGWKKIAETTIDPDARTATFRVANWDDTRNTAYRVVYTMPDATGRDREYRYQGMIRRNPVHKQRIVVAAFTGNSDLGFPHADVVRNVSHFQPDLLVYTGDNIYQGIGGYGLLRKPVKRAILDYLRKWYLFGWEYRELLKDIPAVVIPDDHDVYQGNVWGAGGRYAEGPTQAAAQDQGGYTMPARWVNMVERTQTSDLPDPVDPTPIEQGIQVYYTRLLYGGVDFAILADRMWKSAPRRMLPFAKIVNGWAQNPNYDATTQGDAKGAQLLGPRQEKFLNRWAVDWQGAWMKVVISQTIFADMVTLPKGAHSDAVTPRLPVEKPGEYPTNEAPVADHDSGGWPPSGRNRALRAMRKGFALHIAGDQHLGSTIQYGIDDWNDAGWALGVPSVANVFPRRWYPPHPGRHHKPGMPRYTGEYLDGFGNKMTVWAVANPTRTGIQPAALYDRAPGYGIVQFDRKSRNITIANWPRWVDVTRPGAKPYPGWPITIHQLDNGFPKNGPALPQVVSATPDPVVEVIDQRTGEPVYALRINGKTFTPRVRRPGLYTVKVLDTASGKWQVYRNERAQRR